MVSAPSRQALRRRDFLSARVKETACTATIKNITESSRVKSCWMIARAHDATSPVSSLRDDCS